MCSMNNCCISVLLTVSLKGIHIVIGLRNETDVRYLQHIRWKGHLLIAMYITTTSTGIIALQQIKIACR
jgi:hypothetical protein